MDANKTSNDPLDIEIAALETAISQDNADIAELESLLVQKRQSVQMLSVEVKALKRAASLRPATVTQDNPAPVQAPVAVPVQIQPLAAVPAAAPPAPAASAEPPAPTRLRSVFGQIRTNDPRLASLPGG